MAKGNELRVRSDGRGYFVASVELKEGRMRWRGVVEGWVGW